MPDAMPIPLRNRDGVTVAVAFVDVADAEQATHRWHLTAQGYAGRRVSRGVHRRRIVLLHRELLGLTWGDGRQGDHIDGDRLNCRRANLRAVTGAQNAQNVRQTAGSSRYRGVCWHKRAAKWAAYGVEAGRRVHLGLFDDEHEAGHVAQAHRAANMPYASEVRHG